MALGKTSLRVFKWLYWIFLVLLHIYVVYIMFINNRAILAILWAITGLILIFVFYFYYFPPGDPGTKWPPYVTTCPDYLTSAVTEDGKAVCVDTVGLNSKRLRKVEASAPIPNINDNERVFNNSDNLDNRKDRALTYGLTWEGVI